MCKFERKYAFWFEPNSTHMFGGEVLYKTSEGFIIKPRVSGCRELVIKDVFVILPYEDGIKLQKDLDNNQVVRCKVTPCNSSYYINEGYRKKVPV